MANRFLSESWPISQVMPLALILATPFAIGAFFGLKAILLGDRRGWAGFATHLVLMAIALGMPIAQLSASPDRQTLARTDGVSLQTKCQGLAWSVGNT